MPWPRQPLRRIWPSRSIAKAFSSGPDSVQWQSPPTTRNDPSASRSTCGSVTGSAGTRTTVVGTMPEPAYAARAAAGAGAVGGNDAQPGCSYPRPRSSAASSPEDQMAIGPLRETPTVTNEPNPDG